MTFENLPWVAPIPRQTIDRCIKVSCDAYRKLVTVNLRSTNWSSNLTLNNVWFQKLSIRPPWKGFFLRLPNLPGNFSQASYIYLNAWAFENASQPPPPPTPGISNPFCGGSMDIFWNYTMQFLPQVINRLSCFSQSDSQDVTNQYF